MRDEKFSIPLQDFGGLDVMESMLILNDEMAMSIDASALTDQFRAGGKSQLYCAACQKTALGPLAPPLIVAQLPSGQF